MPYRGKASLACENCRTRRIKCGQQRPQCSQCVRKNFVCSGYRDELALMFRDENVRVAQRVQAQAQAPAQAQAAVVRPANVPPQFYRTPPSSRQISSAVKRPPSTELSFPHAVPRLSLDRDGKPIVFVPFVYAPQPSPSEKGIQFYVEHYLVGYPNEPRSAEEVSAMPWFSEPMMQNIMAAIGLVSLANLNGDDEMKLVARNKYGDALKHAAAFVGNPSEASIPVGVRGVIMLALYEVVKSTHESSESARAHIMGAAGLINRHMPSRASLPLNGTKGLIALCASMFVPCVVSGITLPMPFFDCVQMTRTVCSPSEMPATELMLLVIIWVHLSAFIRSGMMSDGRPKTADILQQLIDVDAKLGSWAARQQGEWLFERIKGKGFPSQAVFHNEYHRYSEIFIARMWGHYRWARILINQAVLDLVERYPISWLAVVPVVPRKDMLETIKELARDILISTATHYRDPRLSAEQLDAIQTCDGSGGGAVGIPTMLFHLKAAACAPGVPHEFWQWSLDVMETMWGEMGMLHARSLAEVLRAHREEVDRNPAEDALEWEHFKVEPVDD